MKTKSQRMPIMRCLRGVNSNRQLEIIYHSDFMSAFPCLGACLSQFERLQRRAYRLICGPMGECKEFSCEAREGNCRASSSIKNLHASSVAVAESGGAYITVLKPPTSASASRVLLRHLGPVIYRAKYYARLVLSVIVIDVLSDWA